MTGPRTTPIGHAAESVSTDPSVHAAQGDERIRTAARCLSTDSVYERRGSNLATPYAIVFGLIVCSTAGWWPVMVFAAVAGATIGWKGGLFAAQDLQDANVGDTSSGGDGTEAVAFVTGRDDGVAELLRDGSAPLGDALHGCERHLLGGGDGLSQRVHGVWGAAVIQGNRDALFAGCVAESVVGDGLVTEDAVSGHAGNVYYRAGFVKRAVVGWRRA